MAKMNSQLRRGFLGAILILWLFPIQQLLAAPTTYGSTGLVEVPTATVVQGERIEYGYYHLKRKNDEVFAIPLGNHLEGSGVWQTENGKRSFKNFNVKYNLQREGIFRPGISVGVDNITCDAPRAGYVVVSKSLPFGVRLSTGVGTERYRHGFWGVSTPLFLKVGGGVFPDTKLLCEHIDAKTTYGLRIATLKGLQFTVGWRDHEPFWGVTYTIP